MTTLYGIEARAKVWALIRETKVALMTTFDAQSRMFHARPMMAQQAESNGTLWFFAQANSRKISEIRANSHTLLTYADPKAHTWVSISGLATVENNRTKMDELWTDIVQAWFPVGKDDPNLVLIRFEAEDAEFWDAPGFHIAKSFSYIKAFMTGERARSSDPGRVHMVS